MVSRDQTLLASAYWLLARIMMSIGNENDQVF